MGVAANFPIALAPGMGLNAVVAYQITAQAGSWQAAMGLVIVNGLVILILVAVGVREAVMDAIPIDLRRAISVGIGLFLALIGAVNAGIVVVPPSSIATLGSNPQALVPPVTHGSLHAPEPLLAFGALVVMALLLARRVSGALLIGIAVATLAALLLGVTKWPDSWFRLPRFDTMFQADVRRAFDPALLPVLVSLIMVDFFDTLGSVTAVAETGRLHDERGRIPRLRAILAVDSIGAAIGGAFGVSSVTSYVESAAGVSEGARTGLHNVVVAALFAACMFAAPMVTVVPAAAAGAALIVVGFLMCQQIAKMDFTAIDTAVPAFLILLLTPLTYSISHGIGYGFIAYVAIKVLHGRGRDVRPMMYVATVMFAAYFWIG
jgi:AGZA family xanthine/uracil permease-like MFS transporter